mmetsp:Transcript_30143/g.65836  ORF Transcript_30143/g.65836 Transcript_30143/m.65836 type:complete len:840 (-) Transcript_30143:63-2582(-)
MGATIWVVLAAVLAGHLLSVVAATSAATAAALRQHHGIKGKHQHLALLHRRASRGLQRRHGSTSPLHPHRHSPQRRRLTLAQQKRGSAHLGKERLDLNVALDRLPNKVVEVFTDFKKKPDPNKAAEVLEQLNAVYSHAQKEKDRLTFECKDKASSSSQELAVARTGFTEAERQLTQVQDRMQSLQVGMDQALAEIEVLRSQFVSHRETCRLNGKQHEELLDVFSQDLPRARDLVEAVTSTCTSGTPPALLECSMPDGSFVTTFKEEAMRDKIANFSSMAEKLTVLHLEGAVRGSHSASAVALTEQGSAVQGHALPSKLHHRHRVQLLQRFLSEKAFPLHLCADAAAPSCESLTDNLATLVGNVQDLKDELQQRAQEEEEHCRTSLEEYDRRVAVLKQQAADAGVALSNAAVRQQELAGLRVARRRVASELEHESFLQATRCTTQADDADAKLCSAKSVWRETVAAVGSQAGSLGAFIGDCEVTEWVRGPCSKECGVGGVQNLTRSVVTAPKVDPTSCPRLYLELPCNEKPCPVDGLMGRWSEWSKCTQSCGGGTRTRRRSVLRKAEHGGAPTAETTQEQLCNALPCDEDCQLAEWTAWSNCSKSCLKGHRVRRRSVMRSARGAGLCPDADDPARRETVPCNADDCAGSPRCNALLDVVFILDASGSTGDDGFRNARNFAKMAASRMAVAEGGVKVAAIVFGGSAAVSQDLTADATAFDAQLGAAVWQKGSTNTAEALALAREEFESHARDGASPIVVVVTDGMPSSSFVLSTEAARLKARGARLTFISVGPSIIRRALDKWASWPAEENIVEVPSHATLDESKVTALLANICPPAAFAL